MKKILLLAVAALAMTSCSKIPYTSTVTVIDYSYFTKKGFFITEAPSVSFDYEPVGSIIVRVENGHEVVKEKNESYKNFIGRRNNNTHI